MVRQTEKWAKIIKTFEWLNTLVRWLWTSDLISVGLSFPSVKWEQWVKFRELGLQLILAAVVVVAYAADFESRFSKHPNPTLSLLISSTSFPKHYAACICFCSKVQAGASTSRLGMNKEWHWGEDSWSLSRVWMCSKFASWWASLLWVYTDDLWLAGCCLCERPPWCHGKPDNHRSLRMWRDVVDHSLLGLQNLKCLQGSADSVNESSCLGMRCKRDSTPFEGYRTIHITGIVDCCLMGMWAQVTVEMPEIQVAFYIGFKLLAINSAFKTLYRPHWK